MHLMSIRQRGRAVDALCHTTVDKVRSSVDFSAPYFNLRDGFAISKAARTPSEVRGGCFYTDMIEGYAPNHRVRLYRR